MSSTTTTTATTLGKPNPLGNPVPPFTPHAISVSLPTWRDNVDYEEGAERVVKAMTTGYPRFFIHLSIQKLARICEQKFGAPGEKCLLLPTATIADQCRAFILSRAHAENTAGPTLPVRLVQFFICPEDKRSGAAPSADAPCVTLHITLFPERAWGFARQFWQHTGMGISSRRAEYCLSLLAQDADGQTPPAAAAPTSSPSAAGPPTKYHNKHYASGKDRYAARRPLGAPQPAPAAVTAAAEPSTEELSVYLEERYGRNLPLSHAPAAKRAMRRRIAGVLVHDTPTESPAGPSAGAGDAEVGPSSRGVQDVTEHDVFLFPTGMTAIWQAHHLARAVLPPAKSVCFGFPYTDTLKILQKWGPGCHFFGHGADADIDELEKILEREVQASPSTPPILALFTEFPSNPLLRSCDLRRLRALADKYDFLLVVDETIGNWVNVEVLPFADIAVSSLSKIFSGDSNVMGGSLILNPKGKHYDALKAHLERTYEDFYFDEDAIYMERNSRDFQRRVGVINRNTEAVCDFLRAHSLAQEGAQSLIGAPSLAVKDVFYPKWSTRAHYDACALRSPESGFGGLFSLTFTSLAASRAFFDALACQKGPSLGTNFTLACPYTVLAHYAEMDWAAGFGVEEGLVRVSIGLEERALLLQWFEAALRAAEEAHVAAGA